MGLQIILFLFLTIGVFCIVRQQKKANRCRRRLELYLKKHMDKPKKKEEKSVSPENVQNKNLHEDEEENRIIINSISFCHLLIHISIVISAPILSYYIKYVTFSKPAWVCSENAHPFFKRNMSKSGEHHPFFY